MRRTTVAAIAIVLQCGVFLTAAWAQEKPTTPTAPVPAKPVPAKPAPPPTTQRPSVTPSPADPQKPVSVALKSGTPDAAIRYTLDGTTPTADSGTAYSSPIAIDKTTTLTAVAFSKDLPPSPPLVSTYLFNPKPGLATFHIGNSLTATTGRFPLFLRTAGLVPQYDSFLAGGHLTWQLWENQLPMRQKEWDTKLAAYKRIDHFTCQPRDFTGNNVDHEADYAIRFFNVIRKHSPDMQPWFYAEWIERARQRPTDQGKMASLQMKKVFPSLSWEESMGAMLLYNEDVQAKVLETYQEGKRPRVLPSCLAMGWIKNMIENGKFPGTKKDDFYPLLFRDQVHPNEAGGYLVDCTWYAAFYGESPEGKLLPAGTGLTLEQARAMEKLAWDVVKNYPDCGLYEAGTEQVAAPSLHSAGEPANQIHPMKLTSATPGAWIRYTLDGSEPSRTHGLVYCGIINLPAGEPFKAIAYKSGMADSKVLSGNMLKSAE